MGPRSRAVKDTDEHMSTPANMSSENRKLRNRLSQKAFRARQAMRIKELEDRLESEPTSDAARTAQLNDRNVILRNQLLNCHKKITRLQISMQTLAESTALALGLDTLSDVSVTTNLIGRMIPNPCHIRHSQERCVVDASALRMVKAGNPPQTGVLVA